jgi:very-short-patch-repair endonuclease
VVGLEQLRAAGVPPRTVERWVATGRLVRLYRGVFAVGHAVLRAEGHYLAAVLACGPGAVLSYASAGALWGIRGSAAAKLDVTSPERCGRRKEGIRVHRGDHLRADEVTVHNGVPCTTAARTQLDLAAVLPQPGVDSVVETAERLELFDLRGLTILIARHRGRRGVGRLRRTLAAFDAEVLRARSEPEARFFHACGDRGLPKPLVNRGLDAGAERLEVDMHWPDHRLIVELDSPYHDTTAAAARDAHRDAALTRAGWRVVRGRPDPRWGDFTSIFSVIGPLLVDRSR